MTERQTRRPEDYLDEALTMLDETGPASQSLGLSVDQIAQSLGLHRATLYRRWKTSGDLNNDILEQLATSATWQAQLLSHDPSAPLADTLDAIFRGPRLDLGTYARAIVTGWSADHPGRHRLAEIEARWLDAAEEWWMHHLRAHGRQLETFRLADLVLAVTALIDGNGLLFLALAGELGVSWSAPDRRRMIDQVLRVVDVVADGASVEPQRPVGDVTVAPPRPDPPLDRLLDVLREGVPADLVPEPRRLVDPLRLAKRISVTERRLYKLWPTTAAMNGDLAVAVLERSRDELAAVLAEMIELGSADASGDFQQILFQCTEAVATQNLRASGATYLSLLGAQSESDVRARTAEPVRRLLDELRTVFLAGQALSRLRRRPDATPDDFAAALRETVVGLQRLTVSHPKLAEDRAMLQGQEVPVTGLIPLLVSSAFIVPT